MFPFCEIPWVPGFFAQFSVRETEELFSTGHNRLCDSVIENA